VRGAQQELLDECLPVKNGQGGERKVLSYIRQTLGRAFLDNAPLKFVALVLALTLFILVHSDEGVYTGVNVGVSYTLGNDQVLVQPPPSYVGVTVRGSRRAIRRLDESEIDRIRIDLTNHTGTEFEFREDMIHLPDGLEFVRFSPTSFPTEFQERKDRTLPVRIKTKGQLPPGYLIDRIIASPQEVEVSGGNTVLSKIDEVWTHPIGLSGKTKSFRATANLISPHEFVELGITAVTVDVTIREQQVTKVIGSVTLKIEAGPGMTDDSRRRFVASPANVSVTLRGAANLVRSISPKDMKASVVVFNEDLATGRTRKAAVNIQAPPGIGVEASPRLVSLRVQLSPGKTRP